MMTKILRPPKFKAGSKGCTVDGTRYVVIATYNDGDGLDLLVKLSIFECPVWYDMEGQYYGPLRHLDLQ